MKLTRNFADILTKEELAEQSDEWLVQKLEWMQLTMAALMSEERSNVRDEILKRMKSETTA